MTTLLAKQVAAFKQHHGGVARKIKMFHHVFLISLGELQSNPLLFPRVHGSRIFDVMFTFDMTPSDFLGAVVNFLFFWTAT